MLMRRPRSYTAEDTVEIDCHGGMLVTRRILETVLKAGARLAEPGEFTKRAFLNGRIDLSQAEAVIDVINAKNEYALQSSVSQLRGSVSKEIHEIRDQIIYEIAFIESALDDPEHISLDGYGEKLLGVVLSVKKKLEKLNIPVYILYSIDGYPNNVSHIVSDEGYGKNDYIKTTRPLVVITAPGPGSGKMATCLSQLYHEYKHGVKAGYAKFETFPIWNIPLKHPVNLAYEAATADLNDVNMIDPFHLEAYGKTTVNYNRDIEIFPVLNAMFELIAGESPYKSPTDMGVNMAGNCIVDDEACRYASNMEIIRRYYKYLCDQKRTGVNSQEIYKIELLMNQAGITPSSRPVVNAALEKSAKSGDKPAVAIELEDGTIVTGKTGDLLGAASSALLNALKQLAGIDDSVDLLSPESISPIQTLKTNYLGSRNPRLHTDEILIALSSSVVANPLADKALKQIPKLYGCDVHSTVILSSVDKDTFKRLGMNLTCEPAYEEEKRFHKN